MKPETREIMEFIPKFANDGRGKTFTARAIWRAYTGQKAGEPVKLRVNGMHYHIISIQMKY